eukprot:9433588-Heterocapsa_arctica.AAC.1
MFLRVPACPGELFSSCLIIFLGMVQSTVPFSPSRSFRPLAAFLQTASVACWMASCSMSFGDEVVDPPVNGP